MAVSDFVGTFASGTAAPGTTIDILPTGCTISGTSVLFLFYNGRTESTDAVGRASYFRGVGVAISSSVRRACCSQGVDANAINDGGSRYTDAGCAVSVVLESTEDGRLDFDSWLSNGARLIVDDAYPADRRIGYWLITGLDNAGIVNFADQAATGNFDVTGLGFNPPALSGSIFVGPGNDTAPPSSRNGASKLSLGFAVSSAKQAVWSGVEDEGSATTDSDSYCIDGVEVVANHSAAAGTAVNSRIAFVSYITDGVRLNQLEVPSTVEQNFMVVMSGGSWDVQSVLTRTDGNDIVTAALGFTPVGVLAISAFKAESTQDVPTVDQTMSIGAASSISDRFAIALTDIDGLADTVIGTAIEHDEIYVNLLNTAGVISLDALMDVKSFDADTITFVMDNTEAATQKFVPLLIHGNAAAGGRTTKNTDPFPLGVFAGISRRVANTP